MTKRNKFIVGLASAIAVAGLSLFSMTPDTQADVGRELDLIRDLGKKVTQEEPKLSEDNAAKKLRAEALAGAVTIDEYLETVWKDKKIAPQRRVSDSVFVRRIYLDIAGRIPTMEETLSFLKSGKSTKRSDLIDELLDSEAYVSDMYNMWSDVLRMQSEMRGDGNQYAAWLKNAIRENKPYNEFAYELITAEGYTWENGAAGYYLRDDGMPLDNMANTVQVFLGTSLVCAQCHDHPFDKWSQLEFYEMAAYTYGIRTRVRPANLTAAQKMVAGDEKARTALNNFARDLTYGVAYSKGTLRLPHDYKYEDAKPRSVVEPYTIFGDVAEAAGSTGLREAYGAWLTSEDNARFTHVIANRLWKKVFGVGLIEPVDMWTDDSVAYHPQLLDYMAHKMRSFDYDQKQFLRMLYNSRTYQREVSGESMPESGEWHFTGPVLRRMSAEQYWDSLMTLTIPAVDKRIGASSYGMYSGGRGAALQAMTAKELADAARKIAKGEDVNLQRMMMMKADDNGKAMMSDERWKGYNGGLRRASELRSPERASHFLRKFGQSDREVISNANREANIVQVLATFNGGEYRQVMAPNSVLMQKVKAAGSDGDKVNVIFYSIMNRRPTSREMKLTLSSVGPTKDWSKVIWALLNTREFSFVQ